MTAASPSRRSLLTALAAVPVAGVPALADVADISESDPLDAANGAIAAYIEGMSPAEKQFYAAAKRMFREELTRLRMSQ
jgi:hypothetical protein